MTTHGAGRSPYGLSPNNDSRRVIRGGAGRGEHNFYHLLPLPVRNSFVMLPRFVHLTIMRLASRLALLLFTSSVLGAPGLTTTTRLVLSHETARPGETVWAGLQFRLEPGWHIYWENSGDSGIPTRVEWQPTPGMTVGELRWPRPERFEEAGLVTYGYSANVVLLAPISIASNAAPGPLTLKAKVSWMECAQVCFPGSAPISATLTIGPETRPGAESGLLDQWQPRTAPIQP